MGFRHDNLEPTYGSQTCSCPDWHGCLMRGSIIGEEGIQPYKFSTCSMQQFNQWMGNGNALCLLNKPNQIPDFGSCGNGIVDEGEACDCGSAEECKRTDPCCDPVTCRLIREAECASGPCCDNCKVRFHNIPSFSKRFQIFPKHSKFFQNIPNFSILAKFTLKQLRVRYGGQQKLRVFFLLSQVSVFFTHLQK